MNVDDVLNFCQNYFGQDWDDTGHKNEVNEMLESTIPSSNRELEPFLLPLYEANESVETSPPELELKPLPETPTYMFLVSHALEMKLKKEVLWNAAKKKGLSLTVISMSSLPIDMFDGNGFNLYDIKIQEAVDLDTKVVMKGSKCQFRRRQA
ncbi:hypothetical protein POM88_023205 [Heracleum sosnowskyi]|uniref:Uncharacterized protein n=1 Tax=Heracleum sosnowskyi TaxID=360622 RepID=A0AAD8MQ99_9APIA|nr:hypothetical protein POM88_023205 [Heracleum sosnowskyi]